MVAEPPAELLAPPGSVILDGTVFRCEDDEPMAENIIQAFAMIDLGSVLRERIVATGAGRIGVDTPLYYDKDRPEHYLVPDIFVALDVDGSIREAPYVTWLEGKAPDFVLEVASPSTARSDRAEKKDLYEWMGVGEYWLFDPMGQLHPEPLQAFELLEGRYVERPREERAGGMIAIASFALGLRQKQG